MPKIVSDAIILEAALATILSYGYEGATTRLIAAAAHINEITLFRKFGTKDKLIVLAVKQELTAFQNAKIVYTGDLQADLEQMVDFYAIFFSQRARLIPLILSEIPRRPELRIGLAELSTIVQSLTTIITQYQAEGILQHESALQTVVALLTPVLAYYLTVTLGLPIDAPFESSDHVQRFLYGRATLSPS